MVHYLDLSTSYLILMHDSVVTTSFMVLFCFAFDCQIVYGIVYYTILHALPFKRLHTSFWSIKPCIVFTVSHYVSMIKKKNITNINIFWNNQWSTEEEKQYKYIDTMSTTVIAAL